MQKKQKPSRGRPKKEFVTKKPKIKRQGPGRPRKGESILTHPAFRQPGQNDNPVKDAIIFGIFIISAIIFGFSLYIARQKKHTISTDALNASQSGNIISQSGDIGSQSWIIPPAPGPISINPLISSFISSINNLDITTLRSLLDPKLKNTATIQTYFTTKRLTRFINSLNDQKLTITNSTKSDQEITYTLKYTLKDTQQSFTETRTAQLVQNQGTTVIGSLRCTTPGCSKMPFFNPGKYGIK